jgi:hypothetical protein
MQRSGLYLSIEKTIGKRRRRSGVDEYPDPASQNKMYLPMKLASALLLGYCVLCVALVL